jgi:hypothetical protein
MDKLNDNITFLLDENDDTDKNNEDEIKNMMYEFTNLSEEGEEDNQYLKSWLYDNDDNYEYINDESFYEKEYTIKDLLKICNYYGIDKNVKTSKCKKQDIISTIVYFESLPENFDIVQKRNTLWKYINELLNDPKMKRFIIWN